MVMVAEETRATVGLRKAMATHQQVRPENPRTGELRVRVHGSIRAQYLMLAAEWPTTEWWVGCAAEVRCHQKAHMGLPSLCGKWV